MWNDKMIIQLIYIFTGKNYSSIYPGADGIKSICFLCLIAGSLVLVLLFWLFMMLVMYFLKLGRCPNMEASRPLLAFHLSCSF